MKNEENRNPEQQDRLIRETFEQYRAGMESMPSQRAKIVYRMTQKTAPDYRVYYRLAAVAAALVLLLGIVVPTVGGNSGLFSRPDQIAGDLAALQPQPTGFIPLAQPEETAAPAEDPDYISMLEGEYPVLANQLVPMNITCDKEGIRMEVLYAVVREQQALFVYSLRDLEGNRINNWDRVYAEPAFGEFSTASWRVLDADNEAKQQVVAYYCEYESLADVTDDSGFTLRLPLITATRNSSIPLDGLFSEFSDEAAYTDVPVLIPYLAESGSTVGEVGTEYYRSMKLQVLDYTRPSDIELHPNILLGGIGMRDGVLHIQLHYQDNTVRHVDEGWSYQAVYSPSVSCLNSRVKTPYFVFGDVQSLKWDTDDDGEADFEEFLLDCDPENVDQAGLTLEFTETVEAIEGGWEVTVPVHYGPAESAGKPDYFSRIAYSNPDLVNSLVPVNVSYEKEGIKLDVLYGTAQENEALLIYSVEDTEGERINELTENPVFPGMAGFDSYSGVLHEYDAENHRITEGMVIRYDDLEACLEESAIPLDMTYLEVCSKATATYVQPRRETVIPGLVELPELLDYYIKSVNGGKREYYTTEDYKALGRKVIDYCSPEGRILSKYVLLSHAEAYGDEFHVQLQYSDWAYWPLREVDVVLLDKEGRETRAGWDGHMRWDADGDGDPDFEEIIFPIDPEGTGPIRFRISITETTDTLEDNWEVRVPLESIRTGSAEETAE